ncbi:hypothetical protein QR680_018747 [Steinernema hermaphroditum]|uniref:7TM GPCR serpentine receptor class x (Srx) domain-containing protein n=1 Tax=Steinernema hermaphroditum TaxID=289476 RepID=A0AA39HL85_9BILA|nr:hypothetical protein QR680_018747 [Steinernema hermaphroditum]
MSYNFAIGALYIGFPTLFVPLYLRVIYIFVSKRKYRAVECYQLMIQIGFIQCTMGIAFFLQGIPAFFGFDPIGIGSFAVNLLSSCFRIETGLSFLLALDRLIIICDVKVPKYLIKALTVVAWLYGVVQFVIFHTPMASIYYSLSKFVAVYDYSLPLSLIIQRTGVYYTWAVSALTLLVYISIVSYLIREQRRISSVSTNFKQKWILIQAAIRFIADASLAVLFHIGPQLLPPSIWITIGIISGYTFDHLLLPPLLYIVLNGNLRREIVLGKESQSSTAVVQPLSSSHRK